MRANQFLLILPALLTMSFLNAQPAAVDSSAPYALTSTQWERVQKKWKRKNVDATLFFSDSTVLKGQIMAMNDSTVFIWKGEGFYSANASDSMSIEIPLEAIDSVHVAGRFIDPRGGLKGLLIGGGAGLLTGAGLLFAGQGYLNPLLIVPTVPLGLIIGHATGKANKHKRYEKRIDNMAMRDYVLFPGSIPHQNDIDSVAKRSPFIHRTFPAKLISLSVFTGVPKVPFQFGITNDVALNWGIAIGVNITPRWSAEVRGNRFRLEAYLPGNGSLVGRTELWECVNVTGNFNVFRTGRLTDRWYQFIIGCGYTAAKVTSNGYVYISSNQTSYGNGYSLKKNLHGFHLQAKAQLFTGPRLAFFCMANTTFLPSVTLPECKATDPTTGETAGMDETRASLSWSAVNFGIQFYFGRK